MDAELAAWLEKNDAAASGWSAIDFDDSVWKTITFPHPDPKNIPKDRGIAWFRKEIDLPAEPFRTDSLPPRW